MSGVVIVDAGLGNLYNVSRACEAAGLESMVTGDPEVVRSAAGIILPGVGAMPVAMQELRRRGVDEALREMSVEGVPIWGICLGMQLLMGRGSEFGVHEGLGLIPGEVVRMAGQDEEGRPLRVPHIGWNAVKAVVDRLDAWQGTPLEFTSPGAFMYFVHSYRVVPEDPRGIVAEASYGDLTFAAAIRRGNVFGCQFHPERSGEGGLGMYRTFARMVNSRSITIR